MTEGASVLFESDGEEEDSNDDEDGDGNDEYLLLHDRFQQALKEAQALEIIHKKHVHQHDECVVQYDGVIKQLKTDIQVLRRQLGKANHTSTQMIKSLPPVIHTNLSLHTLYNKLPGMVVVRVGEYVGGDSVGMDMGSTVCAGVSGVGGMGSGGDCAEHTRIQTIQHSLDMFFIEYAQAKLPSDLSIYNSYLNTTMQQDSVCSNIYNTYLESTLNGQNINTHTLPLLGIQVMVQEFREKTSVFSLLGSVYVQNVGLQVKHTHTHTHSKPDELKHMLKSLLMILIHHVRQNLCVDIDTISMHHDIHSDANIDIHNTYMSYMTPSTAMLHVYKMLFGLDQVRCVSDRRDGDGGHGYGYGDDGDGWNAVRYIDHIQHFPRTRTLQTTSHAHTHTLTHPHPHTNNNNVDQTTSDIAVGDGNVDGDGIGDGYG
ncbi:hypothetical protein EON63_23595, partial [archaeon]